eukprot:m.41343 g.41343  ORF g.41343 m.41343 type:complete len:617 (-) comp9756_c0_seq2:46-1896(-)
MKGKTYEFMWHWDELSNAPTPICSIDVQPTNGKRKDIRRMATGGGDNSVKIWKIEQGSGGNEDASPEISFLSSLIRHSGAVNCVRFSPNGKWLASGSDDNSVIIWELDENNKQSNTFGETEINVENWRAYKTMRKHTDQVFDLAWSPDSTRIVSGSVDKTCIVWEIESEKVLQTLKDHKHHVQGVAWDPRDLFIASQSSDRSCCVYKKNVKKKDIFSCISKNKSVKLGEEKPPVLPSTQKSVEATQTTTTSQGEELMSVNTNKQEENNDEPKKDDIPQNCAKQERLFVEEGAIIFFRRLTFSPDGKLLFCPAGRYVGNNGSEQNTMYAFRTCRPDTPVLRLTSIPSSVICVRCCPIVFEKRQRSGAGGADLFSGIDYRVVFAIATRESVFLYDTEQRVPFALAANLHFAPIMDLSWSSDARLLTVSSQDGYCSVISFNEVCLEYAYIKRSYLSITQGELGKPCQLAPLELIEDSQKPDADLPATETNKAKKETPKAKNDRAQHDVKEGPATGKAEFSPTKTSAKSSPIATKKRIAPTLISTAPMKTAKSQSIANFMKKATKNESNPGMQNNDHSPAKKSNESSPKATNKKHEDNTQGPPPKVRRIVPTLIKPGNTA